MEAIEYDKMFAVEDRHFWFRGRRAWMGAVLGRHLGSRIDGAILDVGCGTGANLVFLSAWGEVFGIDSNPLAIAHCRARGLQAQVSVGSANALGFASGRFALLCLLDVLYHRGVDPAEALREAHRVLRASGYLLVTDAAMPFLAGPHDRAVWGERRFTRTALRKLIEAAGFEVVQISYVNFFLFPLVMVVRLADRLLRRQGSGVGHQTPPGNGVLLQVLRLEAALLAAGLSLPWGSSLVCLARRRV